MTLYSPPGGGGGALPCMGYIGMCGPNGYGFSTVLVINKVSILAILPPFCKLLRYQVIDGVSNFWSGQKYVINRVRKITDFGHKAGKENRIFWS